MMKNFMLIFGLTVFPVQVIAESAWVEINITSIRAGIDANSHYLVFDPITTDPNNCGSTTEASYPTSSDWKIIHATILAALLADKPLKVKFDACKGTRPEISAVEIFK